MKMNKKTGLIQVCAAVFLILAVAIGVFLLRDRAEPSAAAIQPINAAPSENGAPVPLGSVRLIRSGSALKTEADSYVEPSASTIQVMHFAGDVTLEENGASVPFGSDMPIRSGVMLKTGADSYVDLKLDETKAVGLDENSSAVFWQEGQSLRVELSEGGLYFYTTEALAEDEAFVIQTQTAAVDIRGTSGYISANSKEVAITLTAGALDFELTDPESGESRTFHQDVGTTVVYSLQEIAAIVSGSKSEETKEITTWEDIPGLLALRLVENAVILERAVEESGLSVVYFETAAENKSSESENASAPPAQMAAFKRSAETNAQIIKRLEAQDPLAGRVPASAPSIAAAPAASSEITSAPSGNSGPADTGNDDPCAVNGHSYGEWEVTTEPYPVYNGELFAWHVGTKTRTCSRCSKTEDEPILVTPLLMHEIFGEVTTLPVDFFSDYGSAPPADDLTLEEFGTPFWAVSPPDPEDPGIWCELDNASIEWVGGGTLVASLQDGSTVQISITVPEEMKDLYEDTLVSILVTGVHEHVWAEAAGEDPGASITYCTICGQTAEEEDPPFAGLDS